MSVEAHEVGSEPWTRWQGQVVNGAFPLGRVLGFSDHSGVFLTVSAARYPREVAIKLVPANRALAESLLPRWKRAGALAHPHLMRPLEWGGCQLEGLPFLYLVMDHADQTLAQLLPRRALTQEEAREMLVPMLDALAFLHARNLVQGQLKPANILVVGDQLRLAGDTIRSLDEDRISAHAPSRYDPPETRVGRSSTAGDVWALGVTLCEALTQRAPSEAGSVTLPADLSPELREIVTRCLSGRPESRPGVAELAAWARGQSAGLAPATAVYSATFGPAETSPPPAPESSKPAREVAARAAPPVPSSGPLLNARAVLTLTLAVIVIALSWIGVHALRARRSAAGPPAVAHPYAGPRSATPAAAATQASGPAVSVPSPGGQGAGASPATLHQVMPDVSPGARRTIRGHIKVWVRVVVDGDGSVLAAMPDRAGPSRYFERAAVEAAKQWTFAPSSTPARRLLQIRFEFTRDGVTARAVAIH